MSREPRARHVGFEERGVELCLLDWGGRGPTLLLSHANGFCAGTFGLIAEPLTRHYRVFGYDSRGHGRSSKPAPPDGYVWEEFGRDMVAMAEHLCSELGVEKIDYAIGHSFGGTATLTAAAERPDLFARIGLLDPVVLLPTDRLPPEWQERIRNGHPMAEIARKRRDVFESRDSALAGWSSREAFADWDPRALELYARYGLLDREDGQVELACPREVEASVFELGPAFDVFARARQLKTPGVLLRASRGNFPVEVYNELLENAPSLELEDIDAGHLLPMIVPELVAERLIAFGSR